VVVTPATNESGSATITVTVSYGQLSSNETFVVTVTSVNDIPTITAINNQTVNEDSATNSINFTVDDEEKTAGSLTITRGSSNANLVPLADIVLSGTGASRIVIVTPIANENGSATITLTVSDGDLSVAESFVVTVNTVNDVRTITTINNQTINEDNATSSLSFTIDDEETIADNLTLTSSSSDTTLVPSENVVLSGTGASRSVVVTPAANDNGSATIKITVADETFVVTVNSVNDLPTITSISDQPINQNDAISNLNFTVGDVETASSSLTLSSSSDNTVLVPSNNIIFSGSGANRSLDVTPAADEYGIATITLTVADGNGGSQDSSFELSVNAPPTVDAGSTQTVDVDSSVTLTATASDVDGTVTSYSWIQDENGAPSVSLRGDDSDTLSFTTPNIAQDIVFSFTVTVTDDNSQSASDSVEVKVIGDSVEIDHASAAPPILEDVPSDDENL